jgi:hypothetical protein
MLAGQRHTSPLVVTALQGMTPHVDHYLYSGHHCWRDKVSCKTSSQLHPQSLLTITNSQSYQQNMPGRSHVEVPHLGGIVAAYQTSGGWDSSKPTLVMVNSFLTNSNLYGSQYANENLTSNMNLIAIELLGHGETKTKNENWTYWDTATMNLQVLEALEKRGEVKGKVFVLGTSQGGWITARMALLAPHRVCYRPTWTVQRSQAKSIRLLVSSRSALQWTTSLRSLAT